MQTLRILEIAVLAGFVLLRIAMPCVIIWKLFHGQWNSAIAIGIIVYIWDCFLKAVAEQFPVEKSEKDRD